MNQFIHTTDNYRFITKTAILIYINFVINKEGVGNSVTL